MIRSSKSSVTAPERCFERPASDQMTPFFRLPKTGSDRFRLPKIGSDENLGFYRVNLNFPQLRPPAFPPLPCSVWPGFWYF